MTDFSDLFSSVSMARYIRRDPLPHYVDLVSSKPSAPQGTAALTVISKQYNLQYSTLPALLVEKQNHLVSSCQIDLVAILARTMGARSSGNPARTDPLPVHLRRQTSPDMLRFLMVSSLVKSMVEVTNLFEEPTAWLLHIPYPSSSSPASHSTFLSDFAG